MSEFTAVDRRPSLVALVCEEMLKSMSSGRLQPGQNLPSERDLSAQFGVSRTVIREAVRSLEAQGVIEVLTGRGARVASVTAEKVSETLGRYLEGAQAQNHIEDFHISEVRATLEIRLAELASLRASDDEIAQISSSLASMAAATTSEDSARFDAEFHRLIAVATHNNLFTALLEPINAAMSPIRETSLALPGRKDLALQQHRAILRAIQSRDSGAAASAMSEHLIDSRQYYGGGPTH